MYRNLIQCIEIVLMQGQLRTPYEDLQTAKFPRRNLGPGGVNKVSLVVERRAYGRAHHDFGNV